MSFFTTLAGKLSSTAALKLNQAVDSTTSSLDKEKMDINHLHDMVNTEAGLITDLDAQVSTAHDRLTTLQTVLAGKVQDMKDTPLAQPGDTAALQRAAGAVQAAEADVRTQTDLVAGLEAQAQTAHGNYADSLQALEKRQHELEADKATVVLTQATNVGNSIQKQNDAFTAAAAAGNDVKSQIDFALHKAQADAALHGPSADSKALAAFHAKKEADDVLARYGMAPAAAPAAAPPASA